MFELIKEILNQLMALVNYRDAKRRDLFERHIDPLFQLMLQIQKNYRDMFIDLQLKLREKKITKKELLLHLDGTRNELADVRRLAYSTAEVFKERFSSPVILTGKQGREFLKNIRLFAEYIISYFTLKPEHEGISSASYTLIKALRDELEIYSEDAIVTEVDITKLQCILSEIVFHVDSCWSKLCDFYAKIKIQCI